MAQTLDIFEGPMGRDQFFSEYAKPGRLLLLKGCLKSTVAFERWNIQYFKQLDDCKLLTVKCGDVSNGETARVTLREYATMLERFDGAPGCGSLPPYLHDVAIFDAFPQLVADVEPIAAYFSPFYGRRWWAYMQFFMSVRGHVTPLHFDTLITNNTFYQVRGTKRFTLIPWDQRAQCYLTRWRWSALDPRNPDLERFPRFTDAAPVVVDVEEGDVLFMPAGTLHHVESLSPSISFNIDWHTRRSAARGLLSFMLGAPRKNILYNSLIFSGLTLGVPEPVVYRFYRSYLGYVS